jgi:2-(3-amino-3-carboxypropyl)histidine synthase
MAIIAQNLPPRLSSTGFGIITLCQNIGIALSGPIGGFLLQTTQSLPLTFGGIACMHAKDRTAYLFAVKDVTPEVLMEFPSIDAFVNTACPRLSLDDAVRYRKPVLTVNEVSVVLGKLSWEELCRKGLLEN